MYYNSKIGKKEFNTFFYDTQQKNIYSFCFVYLHHMTKENGLPIWHREFQDVHERECIQGIVSGSAK